MNRQETASFNDIEFYVETSEYSGGRRLVRYEFPYRDQPFTDDLGRKPWEFRVDGFLTGDSVYDDRDLLITELENSRNNGTLIHPFYGERKVRVDQFRVIETNSELRIVKFNICFSETGSLEILANEDKKVTIAARIAYIKGKLKTNALRDGLKFLKNAAYTVDSISKEIANKIEEGRLELDNAAIGFRVLVQTLAKNPVLNALEDFIASTLQDFSWVILSSSTSDNGTVLDPVTLLSLGDILAPLKSNQSRNINTPGPVLQSYALADLSSKVIDLSESPNQSVKKSQIIVIDAIDRILELPNLDVELSDTLSELKAITIAAFLEAGKNSTTIVISPPFSICSLLLAYELHGTIASENGICTSNAISHPGFISPQQKIEVSTVA